MKNTLFISLLLLILSDPMMPAYPHEQLQGHAWINQTVKEIDSSKEESQILMKGSYQALLNSLDRVGQHKLRSAQRDWERFKKSHCSFEADYFRSDIFREQFYKACLATMNNGRSTYMKNELKWIHL
jgi:hypothetical protein